MKPSVLFASMVLACGLVTQFARADDEVLKFPIMVPTAYYSTANFDYDKEYTVGTAKDAKPGDVIIYVKKTLSKNREHRKQNETVLEVVSDFSLKPSWWLNLRFNFAQGQQFEDAGQYTSPAGKVYDVFWSSVGVKNAAILVDQNGHVYKDPLGPNNVNCDERQCPVSPFMMGTYSVEPPPGQVKKIALPNDETDVFANFAVVYAGSDSASNNFEIRYFKNGQVANTEKLSFDKFAKTITIKNYSIKIDQSNGTLQYTVLDDQVATPN